MHNTPKCSKFLNRIFICLLVAIILNILTLITDSIVWTYLSCIPGLYIFVVFVSTFSDTDSQSTNKKTGKCKNQLAIKTMSRRHNNQAIKVGTMAVFTVCVVCWIASRDSRWIIPIIISLFLFAILHLYTRNPK